MISRVKQLVKKYREKREEVHVAFIYLEKAYDKVCREEVWKVLHEYEVDGYFVRSMSCLYNESRIYVRLGSRVGEYFEVRRGLIQGCAMSSWLFKIFFDRIVREVNEREMGR